MGEKFVTPKEEKKSLHRTLQYWNAELQDNEEGCLPDIPFCQVTQGNTPLDVCVGERGTEKEAKRNQGYHTGINQTLWEKKKIQTASLYPILTL